MTMCDAFANVECDLFFSPIYLEIATKLELREILFWTASLASSGSNLLHIIAVRDTFGTNMKYTSYRVMKKHNSKHHSKSKTNRNEWLGAGCKPTWYHIMLHIKIYVNDTAFYYLIHVYISKNLWSCNLFVQYLCLLWQ